MAMSIVLYLRLTKLRTFPKIEKVINFESAQNRPRYLSRTRRKNADSGGSCIMLLAAHSSK